MSGELSRLARRSDPERVPNAVAGEAGLFVVDATWGVIQPMTLAPGVVTVGELEVIAHLRAGRALVDCRLANYVERGTIPGAINIPHPEIAARMSEVDRLELEQFLEQPRLAVLATVRQDGTPATTACWYHLQDGKVLITMYTDAHRLPNIRRNPGVAMTILGEDPYQHMSLSGSVREMWDDPDLVVMDGLSMRYVGEPWAERKPCVSALVEIERWHTYGLLSESSDYSASGEST